MSVEKKASKKEQDLLKKSQMLLGLSKMYELEQEEESQGI
tara:strand:+ start:163 stop:282 length:120 start_codon:yes stop_codon:yes gene_type:complete